MRPLPDPSALRPSAGEVLDPPIRNHSAYPVDDTYRAVRDQAARTLLARPRPGGGEHVQPGTTTGSRRPARSANPTSCRRARGRLATMAAGAGSVWRDRDFARYWAGHTVSQVGSQVTELALPLVALFELGASSAQVGLLRAVEFLPYLLLTLPVGVLADRRRRRPLMVGADLGRAAVLAVVPLAAAVDLLDLPLLVAVALAAGSLTVVFDVCYLSVLPGLVARDQIQPANAALEASRAGATVAGPSLGGALVSLLGAPVAIAADAVSFLVSAACLIGVRRPEPAPEPLAGPRGIQGLLVGWRQVARSPLLRPNTLYMAASNLFGAALLPVLIVFQVRELGLSGLAVGVVAAVGNVGFLAGAVTSRRLGLRIGIGPVICAASGIGAAGMAVMGLARPANPYPALVAGQALAGFGIALFNLQSLSLRQAITPNRVLGRVNAAVRLVGWGTLPVGAAAGGWLGGALGPRATIGLCAAGSLLTTAFPLFSQVRRVRWTPPVEPLWIDGEPDPGPAAG
jgi:MFS family permease